MHFLWNAIVLPLLSSIRARTIVEIGTADGKNTANLAEYAKRVQGIVHTIDINRTAQIDTLLETYPSHIRFYEEKSLTALPKIQDYDAVLIDGDHNWYTVYNELNTIYEQTAGTVFPLVLMHDVAWPYGRRDLYYDPNTIPKAYLHPFAKGGVVPNTDALSDEGLNANLYHSLHEHRPRCGVLTAAEDFVAQHSTELTLQIIPGLHGLGIITSHALLERHPELQRTLLSYETQPPVSALIENLESCRIASVTMRQYYETKTATLTQRHNDVNRTYKQLRQESDNAIQKLTQENKKYSTHIQQLQQANSDLVQLMLHTKTSMKKDQNNFAEALQTMERNLKNEQETFAKALQTMERNLQTRVREKNSIIAVQRKKNEKLKEQQQELQAKLQSIEQTRVWRWTTYLRQAAGKIHSVYTGLLTGKQSRAVYLRPGTIIHRPQKCNAVAPMLAASATAYKTVQQVAEPEQVLSDVTLSKTPLVSCILWAEQDNELALRRTLNALVHQTYDHWELHIWHRESHTLIPSVVAAYQDRYPGVIHCHAVRKHHIPLRAVFTSTNGALLFHVQENWLLRRSALEALVRIYNQETTRYNAYIAPHMTADLTGIPTQLHLPDLTKRCWRKRVRCCLFPRASLRELAESNPTLSFLKTALLLRALSCKPEHVYVHDKAICTEFS